MLFLDRTLIETYAQFCNIWSHFIMYQVYSAFSKYLLSVHHVRQWARLWGDHRNHGGAICGFMGCGLTLTLAMLVLQLFSWFTDEKTRVWTECPCLMTCLSTPCFWLCVSRVSDIPLCLACPVSYHFQDSHRPVLLLSGLEFFFFYSV